MFKLSGLYQLPGGFNIATVFTAREGFVMPTFVEVYRTGPGWDEVFNGQFGDDRLPSFWVLNLRLEKVFQVSETSTVIISADAFNITNSAHVLKQQTNIEAGTFEDTLRILNPRVLRFGVRFTF
jgi:hypothetical protein